MNAEITTSLQFPLEVEDGWPPVGSEALPFLKSTVGYKALVAPLFVKNLSVGDIINAKLDRDGNVSEWKHINMSHRSVIWALRTDDGDNIEEILGKLRLLGCNTTGVDAFGIYSIDIPEDLDIAAVDAIISELNNSATVAFPSWRHVDK